MITFDGDRSLKRKWFAEKMIRVIKDIDVPAKATKWDGFTFTAWQRDDLDGGRVTAPMGAIVLCSTTTGIKIAISEYWLGVFGIGGDFYRIRPFSSDTFAYGIISGELAESEWETVPFVPLLNTTLFKVGSDSVSVQNQPCCPSVNPYKTAEGSQFVVSDVVSQSGARLVFFCADLLGYGSNNSGLNRKSFYRTFLGTYIASRFYPRFVCQNRPRGCTTTFLGHVDGNYWSEIDGDAPGGAATVAATTSETIIEEETGILTFKDTSIYIRDLYPAGSIPAEVRNTILTEVHAAFHLGSYSFTNSNGELVLVRASYMGSSTLNTYYLNTVENEKWKICLSILVGNQAYVYNLDQFYDLLDGRAVETLTETTGDPPVTRKVDARVNKIMMYFFPWPNATGQYGSGGVMYFASIPHDSAMFHGHDDKVYTWTRSAGSVKIDTTGMTAAEILVPIEVTDNLGTRPEISHAGNGIYFCSCNKVKESILGTYYGSPFDGWTRLADPEEGTLVQVRPVVVTEDFILLIGVVKTYYNDELVYRFANYTKTLEEEVGWALLGVLPFAVADTNNFAMGLYGDDASVQAMYTYPAPPPATPQAMVGPYENYAEWRP